VGAEIFFRGGERSLSVKDDFKAVVQALHEDKTWVGFHTGARPVLVQVAAVAYVLPHLNDTSLSQ
jgi:hypothetical protein